MKLGKIKTFLIIFIITSSLNAEDKILTAPIINLENLDLGIGKSLSNSFIFHYYPLAN